MPAEILNPSSASGTALLTGAATKLDAILQPDDDDTSYLSIGKGNLSGVIDPKFTSAFEDFPTLPLESPTIVINSVTVYVRATTFGTGTTPSKILVMFGGWTNVLTATYPSSGTWATNSVNKATKSDGSAWTMSDVNALTVELRGDPAQSSRFHDVTTLYVSVDYSVTETPNDPTDLAIDDIDSNFVTLTWTDNSDAETGYEVQRSLNGTDWATLTTTAADVETYTDLTVSSVTHYYYRVRAFNATHVSGWSATVDDTTPAYSGPALEPDSIASANITSTSVDIHWTDGGATDSFELQQSSDGGTTWVTLVTLPKDTTFFSIIGKLPGSSLKFRVRASNTVGTSSWTDEITVDFPERNFRNFLQYEVLQDVATMFDWVDRVKLPDQDFESTQTFHANTNMSAEEMRRYVPVYLKTLIVAFDRPKVNTLKIDKPLVAELPVGTILFYDVIDVTSAMGVSTFYAPGDTLPSGANYRSKKVMIDQNPEHLNDDGSVNVAGAAIGDTILYLKSLNVNQDKSPASGATELPYLMGMHVWYQAGFDGGFTSMGNIVSRDISITVVHDYSDNPKDSSRVYKAMTDEALLKIGYDEEGDVPDVEYQRFRDAGRIAAWRMVAYSAVHFDIKTETKELGLLGSVDETTVKSTVFEMALKQLETSELIYSQRYENTPTITTTVSKPRPSSYSGGVTVRF